MTDVYTVFGNPVAHSRSPQIHQLFAAQTGQVIHYHTTWAEIGQFAPALAQFFASGGKGANVTIPFKQDACAGATQLSPRAAWAQAVNTVYPLADGGYFGDNTDGVGLLRDLSDNHRWALTGKRILLLGAGGAARGVIMPLLQQQPALLTIANRTKEKAQALATVFKSYGAVVGLGFSDLTEPYQVIINATSAGLQQTVPAIPEIAIGRGSCCYDMVYADQPTVFMRWAQQHGAAHTADGLGMLVEQAAEAFFIWRGIRPQTQPVIAALRPVS